MQATLFILKLSIRHNKTISILLICLFKNHIFTLTRKQNMKYLLLFTIYLSFTCIVDAQSKHDNFKNKFDDVFEEDENENLTLRFFNALNGDVIPNALVQIEGFGEFNSDEEGKVRFPIPENDGFLLVHFECDKFITSDFKVEVIAGTLFFNRISVSPELDLKHLRIVLDWDAAPKDLDAHFIKTGGYHISYRHTRILADGSGELDRDDMDGYGPETITIRDIDDLAEYEYFIHDYTNKTNTSSAALSRSKATVKVYGEGKLLYVFQIPQSRKGTKWSVFKLMQGQFIESNTLTN